MIPAPPATRFGIVKVGGSLFDWPPLPQRLAAWLDLRARDMRLLLLAGGGQRVDSIRNRQFRTGESDEACHWAAIAAMEENTRELNHRLPAPLPLVETTTVFALSGIPVAWLLPHPWAARQSDLPANWEVTSDSLAARVALELGTVASSPANLTLLKSRPLASPAQPRGKRRPNWTLLAAEGAVDSSFPTNAGKLPAIEWLNFRVPDEEPRPLSSHGFVEKPDFNDS